MMKTALGLMSGTSMDGIDVALVHTDGDARIEFGPSMAVDYPADVRSRIEQGLSDAKQIVERQDRPGLLADLEAEITKLHEDAVLKFLAKNSLRAEDIDLIGFHGQTVLHRPDVAVTVQLGDGPALASATGIDVVYDMRANDMTFGGQGAPLVPVFHQALAAMLEREGPICFVNIGGISNITYIDENQLVAFDTGPGNALIDQWTQMEGGIPYDAGGAIASEGSILREIADGYLQADYFERPVPKSLDRNDFSPLEQGVAELADGARTLAYVTAASIIAAKAHLPKPPQTWIVCGGGRLNGVIMIDLAKMASQDRAEVVLAEDVDLQGDMLEAQAFAYLAVRSSAGLPLTFPLTTGCSQPVTGGVLARAR